MTSPMVRIQRLTRRYGSVTALDEIDLEVEEGEFLTLLGPSGSGKTTLLNLISGTIVPSSGRIWISGRDVTGTPSNERGIGMVFQNYALFPHMTIAENIAFPLRVRGLRESEIRNKVEEVLELVQLKEMSNRKPKQLSGGQQQRVAIARCIVYKPSLVLMDEPLGALDKKLREQMQIEIKRLHNLLKMTVLYVTHDQEEAMILSDRICLMQCGRIEQLGTPYELYFRPNNTFVADFLGESNIVEDGGLLGNAPGTTMMVRPENVQVLVDGQTMPCGAEGVIEEIVFAGAITNFRVRLSCGARLVAKRLTSERDIRLEPGCTVRLGWYPSDVVVLRGIDASELPLRSP